MKWCWNTVLKGQVLFPLFLIPAATLEAQSCSAPSDAGMFMLPFGRGLRSRREQVGTWSTTSTRSWSRQRPSSWTLVGLEQEGPPSSSLMAPSMCTVGTFGKDWPTGRGLQDYSLAGINLNGSTKHLSTELTLSTASYSSFTLNCRVFLTNKT